jgi:nucleoside-diphosphate kinase
MAEPTEKVVVILKPHLRNDFPKTHVGILAEALNLYMVNLGLMLLYARDTTFTRAQAEDFYAEHAGKSFYNDLINATISGPCTVLILQGDYAIQKVRNAHGDADPSKRVKGCLRKKYGRLEYNPMNGFHATAENSAYKRECVIATGELI